MKGEKGSSADILSLHACTLWCANWRAAEGHVRDRLCLAWMLPSARHAIGELAKARAITALSWGVFRFVFLAAVVAKRYEADGK